MVHVELMVDGKVAHVALPLFLLVAPFVFFSQVMTWVWLLSSRNTSRLSPSLPPVCSRYPIDINVENNQTRARFAPCKLTFSLSDWQNAELKFNFGGEDFKNAPKSGFVALNQAPEAHQAKSSQTGERMQPCFMIDVQTTHLFSFKIKAFSKQCTRATFTTVTTPRNTSPLRQCWVDIYPYVEYLSLLCVCVGTAKVSEVKATSNAPKALIIEPSKELAEQTLNVVKQFKKYVENPKLRYDSTELASTTCGTHTKNAWLLQKMHV